MDRFTALLLTIKVAKLFCAFINGCQNLFRTLQYLVTETSRTAEPGALQKFYHVSVTLLSIVWLEAASRCFLHTAEAAHCSCDLEEVQQHLHSVSASAINIEVIMPERGGLTNRNKIPPHILPGLWSHLHTAHSSSKPWIPSQHIWILPSETCPLDNFCNFMNLIHPRDVPMPLILCFVYY